MKNALYKTVGNTVLTWKELSEVVLDIEIALNNRPLSYVDEDIQHPVLTPNSFLFIRSNTLPELAPHNQTDRELRKRANILTRYKDALWSRWTKEYLRSLRERHNLNHPEGNRPPAAGDVVIIQTEDRNRGKWPRGIVEELYPGRDGVVRSVKLRAGKSFLERAVQQLYPLELSCDRPVSNTPATLNAAAPPFRPRRDAAVAAELRIHETAQLDNEYSVVNNEHLPIYPEHLAISILIEH